MCVLGCLDRQQDFRTVPNNLLFRQKFSRILTFSRYFLYKFLFSYLIVDLLKNSVHWITDINHGSLI